MAHAVRLPAPLAVAAPTGRRLFFVPLPRHLVVGAEESEPSAGPREVALPLSQAAPSSPQHLVTPARRRPRASSPSSGGSAAAAAMPPPLRRRLRSKTPAARVHVVVEEGQPEAATPPRAAQGSDLFSADAGAMNADPSLAPDENSHVANPSLAPDADAATSHRVMYQRFIRQYQKWVESNVNNEGGDEDARERTRKLFRLQRVCDSGKQKLVSRFIAEYDCGQDVATWALQHFKKKCERRDKPNIYCDGKTALLTWQGDWGVFTDIPLTDDAPSEVDREAVENEITAVVHAVRAEPRAGRLWESLQETARGWCDKFHLSSVTCALELCTHTLASQRVVRVHAHVFFRTPGRMQIHTPQAVMWMDGLPFKSSDVMGASRPTRSATNAGMYYVQAPKIGQLWSWGSLAPFRDYLVSGEWIMNLVQAGKMTYASARSELVRTSKNLTRLLPALDMWHREVQREALRDQMTRVQQAIDGTKRPFRVIPEVVEWVRSHEVIQMRYKFLVLVGGSGLGKTQYAKSLVPSSCSLELNMASAPEPDLREYDPQQHQLVLFDECEPKQVLRQKKLFQCPPVEVGLAASATSCHAYKVWVHQKLFVVASNVWQYEVSRMKHEDAEWLNSNSVVVHVTQPLWQT